MPPPSFLRATGVALLVAAPLALSSACALPQSGVPASQSVPVGGGAPLNTGAKDKPSLAASDISTTLTSLGTVLTTSGFALYRYSKDSGKPSKSNCTGKCATTWPPVIEDGPIGTNVIDPKMMGSLRRPDGTEQLTINGWPVYRYAKDTAPGAVTGQGVDGAWSAIGFDGQPVRNTDDDATDPDATDATTAPAADVASG
jgi:predicted lipoprotein with Yx(FWY)xxD motif